MPFEDVFVRPIAGSVEALICDHADPPKIAEEGEIILCEACTDALRFDGAKLVDAETLEPFIELPDAELQEPFTEPLELW